MKKSFYLSPDMGSKHLYLVDLDIFLDQKRDFDLVRSLVLECVCLLISSCACSFSLSLPHLQVYGPETTQRELFQGTVKDLVKEVLEGGNSLVFTYGVTNAGKTFTFLGPFPFVIDWMPVKAKY